jgi:triosephosphate isomerase
MFSNKKIIAGNWKMNGLRESSWRLVEGLLEKFADSEQERFQMIICPPATLLSEIAQMVEGSPLEIGAQNASDKLEGAYTGEISPVMLKDLGAKFVILGHSERRQYFGETDALVAAKAAAALSQGITPIICIGETDEQKSAGHAVEVVKKQLNDSLPAEATLKNVIVAYEPVWAIGTGKSATTADIVEIHSAIRDAASARFGARDVSILYGGSVKGSNAAEIFAIPDVDGVLVGGASLKADDFWAIAQAA